MKLFICRTCESRGKEIVGCRRTIREHIKNDHLTLRDNIRDPNDITKKLGKYKSIDPKTSKVKSKVSAMMAEAVEDWE